MALALSSCRATAQVAAERSSPRAAKVAISSDGIELDGQRVCSAMDFAPGGLLLDCLTSSLTSAGSAVAIDATSEVPYLHLARAVATASNAGIKNIAVAVDSGAVEVSLPSAASLGGTPLVTLLVFKDQILVMEGPGPRGRFARASDGSFEQAELASKLREIRARASPATALVLSAAPSIPHSSIARLLRLASECGFARLYLGMAR